VTWIAHHRWRALPGLARLALGTAIPLAATVLAFVAAGTLASARFWFLFNFSYIDAGPPLGERLVRMVVRGGLVAGSAALLYGCAIAGMREAWTTARGRFVLGWVVVSALCVGLGGRFFGHYFHQLTAPLCVLAAPVAIRVARRRWFIVALVLPAATYLAPSLDLRRSQVHRHQDMRRKRQAPRPEMQEVAAEIGQAMNFYERPSFIPASIVTAPIDFPWRGAQAHIGPVEVVTPLLKSLGQGTGLAQVAQCAGVLLWAIWRLKNAANVDHNLEVAEAAFAYCVDWRYFDETADPWHEVLDQPPALSAAMKVNSLMLRALDHEAYWNSFYQPVSETFHSTNIVHHILPKPQRRDFKIWLDSVIDRVQTFFPLPDIPNKKFRTFDSEAAYDQYVTPRRGVAVPPQILDPGFDYKPQEREALLAEFLGQLDPQKNRYLRSPVSMLKLGFVGVPYRLP